jgi:hypothetical protein
MRHFVITILATLLGTSACSAQQGPPGSPQPRSHGKPVKIFRFNGAPPSENVPEKMFLVSSQWDFTKQDALANALEKAREQVEVYLRDQKPSLEWTPKAGFVRERMLGDLRPEEVELRKKELGEKEGKGELVGFLIDERFRAIEETRKLEQARAVQGEDVRETKRVWLRVVINPETWKQIQKESRQAEDQRRLKVTEKRMVFLVKFLVGIVALLLTICGYIRLDEWSKGYYTQWLRLGAIACFAAVTVLLWSLLRHGRL